MKRSFEQTTTLNECHLTEKQAEALTLMKEGHNIFITGPAGTGKSFLVNRFKEWCDKENKILAVTSTTGVAALNIHGRTLHSWSGIGIGKGSSTTLTNKIMQQYWTKKRWIDTEILIIDEISMSEPSLFDKLDKIGRFVRNNQEDPFGGIQLIVTGDFCQLPPVTPGKQIKFCFESKSWKLSIKKIIYLNQTLRQSDDKFVKILNEIRLGNCSNASYNILKECKRRKLNNQEGIQPTILYSVRKDVDSINNREIQNLIKNGEKHVTYKSSFSAFSTKRKTISEKQKKMFKNRCKKECQAVDDLTLVNGAQVMLIANLDLKMGLVNGSRGVVVSLEDNSVEVKFLNGIVVSISSHNWIWEEDDIILTKSQLPLVVAYSMTIHKTQSQTLDCVILDLRNVFEYGQAYAALSRVRSLEGLELKGLIPSKIKAHPKVIEFYKNLI